MKIAICDDDYLDLEHIHALVKKYNESLDVTLFTKAKDLLSAFSTDFFDLVFLDIEMERPNGYDVAKELMQRKDTPLIVFVTISAEYTLRGYGIAFRYLPKPIIYETLAETLTKALEVMFPKRISIDIPGGKKLIAIHDILYIEVTNHILVLHTSHETYRFRGKLKEIETKLPDTWFSKPHNSFIVNLGRVISTTRTSLKLDNGVIIPISQRNYKSFDRALIQYIGRE